MENDETVFFLAALLLAVVVVVGTGIYEVREIKGHNKLELPKETQAKVDKMLFEVELPLLKYSKEVKDVRID